ncbi:type II secretion system F family protein [Edaphobacter paludis]|uniref:Type II secretion system F family protein n=1 Tax=Edaphobacter paludis TaxID=3035702 RepID=A0AAU7D2R4_9BACT
MILLVLGFSTILIVTFSLVALATGPTQLDKTVQQRLAAIKAGDMQSDGSFEGLQLLKISRTSQFGWLEAILEKYGISQKLQTRIAQSASSTTVSNLVLLSLALAAAGFFVSFLVAPMLPLELGAAFILSCIPYIFISWKRSKRIQAFNAALPGAVDMMGRALRAGHSMAAAIEMVSQDAVEPAAFEFREVFKQQNFGLPLRDALLQMLDRVPSQDLRVLVTAILVQRDTGGNLVEILDRTVFIIRERLRIHGEIRIQTAQGRMTGWILSALPILMLLLTNAVNPGYSSVLMTDPGGRKMIYAAVVLIVLGSVIIHRIVNGIEV